jgi:hypothetical protein
MRLLLKEALAIYSEEETGNKKPETATTTPNTPAR